MTRPIGWKPSPQLEMAMRAALTAMQAHWPKALALATQSNDAGRAFVADYCHAMLGADLEAIPEAAKRWVSNNGMWPRPYDFAKLVRDVTREMRPPQYGTPLTDDAKFRPPPPIDVSVQDRSKRQSRRAYDKLKSTRLVGDVWQVLLQHATTAAQRSAIRAGDVADDEFDLAVDIVLENERKRREDAESDAAAKRAAAGPLAETIENILP